MPYFKRRAEGHQPYMRSDGGHPDAGGRAAGRRSVSARAGPGTWARAAREPAPPLLRQSLPPRPRRDAWLPLGSLRCRSRAGGGGEQRGCPRAGAGEHPERVCLHAAATPSHRHPPPPRPLLGRGRLRCLEEENGRVNPEVKKSAAPLPGKGQSKWVLASGPPACGRDSALALKGEERAEGVQGEFRSPGSHIEETCVFGEPRRSTSFPCSGTLPCAHVCTAPDLPWFRHVAL